MEQREKEPTEEKKQPEGNEELLNFDNTLMRTKGGVIAFKTNDDGTKEDITFFDFLRDIDSIITSAGNGSGEELADLARAWSEYLEGLRPKIEEDMAINNADYKDLQLENVERTLQAFERINEFLKRFLADVDALTDERSEELAKFFKGDREFMAVPRPRDIEQFMNINITGNAGGLAKVTENISITFSGRLAIEEQKINEMFRLAFASMNPYKAHKNLHRTVEIGLTQTMEILGKPTNANNKKMFVRKLNNEILPNIAHTYIERKETGPGGKIRTDHWELGGGYWSVDTKRDRILFTLSDGYALYLNKGAFSQLNYRTLSLGTQKNPLAFYVAQKLQTQYFHDGNRRRTPPTNTILGVSTILDFCANEFNNCLPTFENVQRDDPGHWKRRIRDKLEAALNEIQEAGLYKWEYCKAGMKPATPQEIKTDDYYTWAKLYITFTLIPEEPDQTERLEHKQQRIDAARKAKEVKDAETIVKADKIRRRKKKEDENPQKRKSTAPKG